MTIPFNIPYCTGKEMEYMRDVLAGGRFVGGGVYSKRCAAWIERTAGCAKAILVPSGTAALDMMLLLADLHPGDEVILPSFTFSSTANAVVLRGGVPVFVDIRPDTLNMDEGAIEAAITSRTKAILPVHYAGAACEMDAIGAIAERHGLLVLEDAAQCILSYWKGRHLGTLGAMGALSFHETKNVQCGEGGALLVNDPRFLARAEIVMEKGTDRSRFLKGEVDKYTWVDVGSSYLVNEMTAAFLLAQLEDAASIVGRRVALWEAYDAALEPFERKGRVRRPVVLNGARHNAHVYPLLFGTPEDRDSTMAELKAKGLQCLAHYLPLHSSTAGRRFGRSVPECLPVSERIARTMLRLPLYMGLDVDEAIAVLCGTL